MRLNRTKYGSISPPDLCSNLGIMDVSVMLNKVERQQLLTDAVAVVLGWQHSVGNEYHALPRFHFQHQPQSSFRRPASGMVWDFDLCHLVLESKMPKGIKERRSITEYSSSNLTSNLPCVWYGNYNWREPCHPSITRLWYRKWSNETPQLFFYELWASSLGGDEN